MKINNQYFEIFLFDNIETIKDRIAVEKMNTILKYIVFEPDIKSVTQEGNVEVTNVLIPVLNKSSLHFPETIDFKKNPREIFEYFFITTNTTLIESTANQQFFNTLLSTMKNLTVNPSNVWKERESFLKNYNNEFNKLENKVNKHKINCIEFERIPEIEFSRFEMTNAQFTIDFGPTDLTLFDLFNNIQVTKYIPYINMDKLYKIHYDFIPSKEWLTLETGSVILMKVDCEILAELRSFKNPFKKYTNAAFAIIKSGGDQLLNERGGPLQAKIKSKLINEKEIKSENRLIATMDMNVGYRNISRYDFIQRVLDSLNIPMNRIVQRVLDSLNNPSLPRALSEGYIQELSIIGYYSYPFQTLLIPIWSDLVMNNPFFSPLVAIDESVRASKIKANIYLHMIGNGMDSASLMMKTADKTNMFGMSNEGEKYIRSRIKTKTEKDMLNYQRIISRFFTIYNNEKANILSVYKVFIPNFLKEEENNIKKKIIKTENLGLRAIAPDLFLPNYSRKCLKKPTIIPDNKAAEYEQTGEKQVMYFPNWGESTRHNYICEHATHPYPGLRDNQLENKETYPFLPCCYSKDQMKREGSKYRHYYEQESLKKRQQQSQDLFVTNKILPPGIAGILPKNIKDLFTLLETNPKYMFVRIGMNKTEQSLLECVLVAKGQYNSIDPKARLPFLTIEKNKLAVEKYAMAAKQELFNESINDIIQRILNEDMNATDFVHLMEQAFDCNIFIFASDDKHPNGALVIPKHVQAYFKFKPTRETILIYQHVGSESDNAAHPQCELIARSAVEKVKTKNIMSRFLPTDPVVMGLWTVFRKLNRTFIFNRMMPSVSIKKIDVKSQIIDIYGKCRVINVLQKNGLSSELVTMISDPIPPYAAVSANQIYRASLKSIKLFADEIKAVLVRQKVNRNRVREVNATVSQGNINVTFLTDDPNRLQNVPMIEINDSDEEYRNIFGKSNNVVTRFVINKRLSKIIFQYLLYIFSIYINNISHSGQRPFNQNSAIQIHPSDGSFENSASLDRIQPLNEEQFVQFVKNRIVIIPDHNYEYDENDVEINLSSKFDLNSNFVQRRTKLITTSTEMVKRLIFMLRLYQLNHFEELREYKNKINIEDFYDEVSDFDQKPFEIFVEGAKAVKGLIQSYKTQNIMTKNIKANEIFSYFFYNEYLSNTIYIAQNTQHISTAVSFVKFWHQYGYNPTETDLLETVESGELSSNYIVEIYSYVNDRLITKIGNSNSNENPDFGEQPISGAVLGYLINEQPRYTALMPL